MYIYIENIFLRKHENMKKCKELNIENLYQIFNDLFDEYMSFFHIEGNVDDIYNKYGFNCLKKYHGGIPLDINPRMFYIAGCICGKIYYIDKFINDFFEYVRGRMHLTDFDGFHPKISNQVAILLSNYLSDSKYTTFITDVFYSFAFIYLFLILSLNDIDLFKKFINNINSF